MPDRWLGISVVSDKVTIVDVHVPDSGPLVLQMDATWDLQAGDRPTAYAVMHDRIENYMAENGMKRAAIKASALSMGSTKMAHLESCELRGVVMSAARRVAPVECIQKAHMSRTFGKRKVDEYVKDNAFWSNEINGKLRLGSREAAMVLLAARKNK